MNYPNNIKKSYHKIVNYANRGMDLENLVNIANDYYLENDLAVIYKKPTPIQVNKYNYDTKRITDAFYKNPSTLDYNGIYKGIYIEFDAKNTEKSSLPLTNIAQHQIKHIEKIINHGGIAFLLIMIKNNIYALNGNDLLSFIKNTTRKSIPFNFIDEYGIKLEYSYFKGVNYLPAIDRIIKEKK